MGFNVPKLNPADRRNFFVHIQCHKTGESILTERAWHFDDPRADDYRRFARDCLSTDHFTVYYNGRPVCGQIPSKE